MNRIAERLTAELNLKPFQVQNTLELLDEGATIPFIARYRKERTGELNETQLREVQDRYAYLTELEDRKATILKAIAEQGKLTPELQAKIDACDQKTELEDLYLPYKPKRRTRATMAREKGLEPLAQWLEELNQQGTTVNELTTEASRFIDGEKGVASAEDALQGASDILAETMAERAELRAWVRDFLGATGSFKSKIKDEFPEGSTKFETYRQYQISIKAIASHNLLALLRGEKEGILTLELSFDEEAVLQYLESQTVKTKVAIVRQFYRVMLEDAFKRLMKTSLINAVITDKKDWADIESIKTFEANLRELLLAAPAGMKPTLAIDPGFRTGCKVAVIDTTGKFLHYQAIFPHTGAGQRQQAVTALKSLINSHQIELIAIGNGTASRETDAFVTEVLQEVTVKPIKVIVNEAGASVYSASEVAIAEFPELDVTVRGAISIGRRLQDPLAELVKIDPKSIGVGQYQHDVDQKLLKQKLEETIESCVNYVGVDLNTASKELLTHVSGISTAIANNIITYRNSNGAFKNRRQLLKVPKLGPKAFEQAAGFLRIRGGDNPLDNTAVHPERYEIVSQILKDIQVDQKQPDFLKTVDLGRIDLKRYVNDSVGEPTLRDILQELEKPGRDPRAQFTYAQFRDDIQTMADLQVGMELEGVITNVANFGAFVDIGVHQDGLVHISQLADQFVSDPKAIVKVGQVVKVRVLEVNVSLKRISLSMKALNGAAPQARFQARSQSGAMQRSTAPSPKGSAPKGERGDRPQPAKPHDSSNSPAKETGSSSERSQPNTDDLKALDALKAKFNQRRP